MVLRLEHFGKSIKKRLISYGMWCCRRMEKISWTDLLRNEKLLQESREEEYPRHDKRKER